ncbi:MAG TPA: hypothetical protein DCY13_03665 [Verrucomicrobiales bacterium]|nr:hypothetical protein [Verrucomicrobiales bacterium]
MNRTIQRLLIAGIVVAVLAAGWVFHRHRQRQPLPQFEGRTAQEWLEHFAQEARGQNHPYLTDELARKELEVVFRSLGSDAQRQMIGEYLELKPLPAWRGHLVLLGRRVPERFRFGLLRNHELERHVVIRTMLEQVRPPWDVFAPEINAVLARKDTNRFPGVLNALGMVGDGSSNAVPILISGLTNQARIPPLMALQSLGYLGTNAAPAIPWIMEALELRAWNSYHLRVLGSLGEHGAPAVPLMERYLNGSHLPGSANDREIAIALLRIDPSHAGAMEYLEKLVTSPDAGATARPTQIGVAFQRDSKNPAFAKLIRLEMAGHRQWVPLLHSLMRHDPDEAVTIARARLAQGRHSLQMLSLLLQHDPYDPFALQLIGNKIRNPFFPRDAERFTWLFGLQFCFSDSPGVLEMLEIAARQPEDSGIPAEVRRIRRHIELNDQLRRLRALDAERQLPGDN